MTDFKTEFRKVVDENQEMMKNLEPKMSFRWLVEFPEEFSIPAYLIQKCQLPKYKDGAWQIMTIEFIDTIVSSSSEGLMNLINHCEQLEFNPILFTYIIHVLDPVNDSIERWQIEVEAISVEFGELDYNTNNDSQKQLLMHKLFITPASVKLLD